MSKSPDAFRTISEVAEWLQTPAHVLRFWESKFAQVKPVKRAGGRRYYRPADMLLLGGIKKLLHDDGMTIKGVQKVLRERGVRHVAGLSVRKLEGEDAGDDPAEEAAFDDEAPFVEVEPPEPEERLIAFPARRSRGAPADRRAAEAPEAALADELADEEVVADQPEPDAQSDALPTEAPVTPLAEGDETDAATSDAAPEAAFDEDAADEMISGTAEADDAAQPDDAPTEDQDPGDASDTADHTDPGFDFDADEAPTAEASGDGAAPGQPLDGDAEEAAADIAFDDAAPFANMTTDADPDSDTMFETGDETAEAPVDAAPDAVAAPVPAHSAPLMADLPGTASKPMAAGPLGRIAWIESLDQTQREALREALPALRALHERLATPITGTE